MAQEIQARKPGFVALSDSVEEIEKRFKAYQDLKKRLLTADDVVKINNKEYIKKSGRSKFEVAFNLSTSILEERKEVNPNDSTKYSYHFTVQCKADNGRIIQEVGSCDNTEKPSTAEHVIRSMAKTRATSRAVFEMIGAGDVAAEEAELIPHNTAQESQFCKDESHKHTLEEISTNKCKKTGKMVRMP